ncbi:endo alpha-1,4 polygalactosaminidase [Streptomyces sp. NPDC059524]|uniref:endo alpha-1,4 polygalactosaminidase n=1 Tax=Streptomyces sp. NPDC059524 TaxID=3346856 RepID=UPI00368BF484
MIFHAGAARLRRALAPVLAAAVLAGCSATPDTSGASPARVSRPPAGAAFDYQLGGPYRPGDDVRVVARDRTARPVRGLYNICYVNAFQAQPDATRRWRRERPELLLRDADGRLVVDEDWGEPLLDISTAGKRSSLAGLVGRWFDGCADSGFQAVEPDNLDSYTRSKGLLKKSDALAFARLLASRAHAAGLAVGQKNTAELLPERAGTGFDFAVAEECARYDECGAYAKAYDDRVYVIEYRARDFARACARWGDRLSVVLRDRDVRPAGAKGYVRRAC